MGNWQGVAPASHQNPALPTMSCSPSVGSCTTSSTVTVCLVCQASWGEPLLRDGPMPGETEAGSFGDTPTQARQEAERGCDTWAGDCAGSTRWHSCAWCP